MKANKKYTTRYKISNILGIIAGIVWVFIGVQKTFVDSWANIGIAIIGVIMIVLNLSLLKDNWS